MVSHWIHEGLTYISQHPHYGYLFSFIVSCLESLPVLGTVIPGSVTMTGVGTLIGTGTLPLFPTMISAILGAFTGDVTGFLIGRLGEERIFKIWPFKNNKHWLEYGRSFFNKHGMKSVIIGRFIGPIRSAIPMIASLLGMAYSKFFLAGIFSAIMWAIIYITPGILLGRFSIHLSKAAMAKWLTIIIGLLVVLLIIYALYRLILKLYNKYGAQKIQLAWDKFTKVLPFLKVLENRNQQYQNIPFLLIIWLIILSAALLLIACFKPFSHNSLLQLFPHMHHYLIDHHLTFQSALLFDSHLTYEFVILAAFLTFIPCSSFRKALYSFIIYVVLIGIAFIDKSNYSLSLLCLENYLIWLPLAIISFVERTRYDNYIPPIYVYYGVITLILNLITILLLQTNYYTLLLSWVVSGIMISLFSLFSYPINNQHKRHIDSMFINMPFFIILLIVTFL